MGAYRSIQVWAYGLVGGCIGGGASAVFSWMSLAAAKAAGLDVPQLNFNAVKVMFLTGVITHGCAFLMKAPLPKLSGDTEIFQKGKNDGKNDQKAKGDNRHRHGARDRDSGLAGD
jgi:hypothetical protein